MARDPVQKVLKSSTESLETYPPILATATGTPTARIGTPSTAMPTSGSNASVDSLSCVVSVAAVEGDETISVGSSTTVTDTETGLLSNVTNPMTVLTQALSAGTRYTIAVSFSMSLDANEGGGPVLDTTIGSITGTFTVGASSITIDSQTTTYTGGTRTLMTTVELSSSGLNLLVRVSGDISGLDITRSTMSLTATPIIPDFVKGRRYLITTTTGEAFPVTAAKTETDGTTMYLAEPLPRDVAAGSTITGLRISIALSSSQTSGIGRGLVEWSAVLGGITEKWASEFRIIERDGSYSLAQDRLTSSSPYCRDRRADDDDDYSEMIDAAWRLYMLPVLYAKNILPEDIVSRDLFEPAHIAACELFVASNFKPEDEQRKKQSFKEAMELTLAGHELWLSAQDVTPSVPEPEAPRAFTITQVTK